MEETIASRFSELLEEGLRLRGLLPSSRSGGPAWMVESSRVEQYQAWLSSCANLLEAITLPGSTYHQQLESILNHEHLQGGVPTVVFHKVLGLLTSAKQEWDRGLLRQIEYIVTAEAFDDFLDHASLYHKGNKKVEASVLASAVLEDTIKRIAKKNGIDTSGRSLEQLIDELVRANVFTAVKAKRIKGHAGVRNRALHAEWDEFDIREVGYLIEGTRDLIDEFL